MALKNLKVFQKTYNFLLWVKHVVRRFAKVHKYSLGIQLEEEVLKLLKQIIKANMEKDKKEAIKKCFVHLQTVRVFLRIGKDLGGSKVLSMRQYKYAAEKLDEIGRMLYGWYGKYDKE